MSSPRAMLHHGMTLMPFHFLWIVLVLMVLAAIAVVVVVAALGVTHLHAAPSGPPGAQLDILARRVAAGEITAEEYQEARVQLHGGRSKCKKTLANSGWERRRMLTRVITAATTA